MTVRKHLQELHGKLAEHHMRKSEHHKSMASHFEKLASHFSKSGAAEREKETKGICDALAGEHEEMSQHHAEMAEYHSAQMEECSKAADGDLQKRNLDAIVPDGVHRVTPTPPSVRAVPRAGMAPIADKPNVPAQFEKLVSVEWDEEESSLLRR